MEPKECFLRAQYGYCWIEQGQWMFQAIEIRDHPVREQPVGEAVKVELSELVFHHDEDEELH